MKAILIVFALAMNWALPAVAGDGLEAVSEKAVEAEPAEPAAERADAEAAKPDASPENPAVGKYPRDLPAGHSIYWLMESRGAYEACRKELADKYDAAMKVDKIALKSETKGWNWKTSTYTVSGELITGKLVTGRFTLEVEQKMHQGEGPVGNSCKVVDSHAPMAERPKKKWRN